MQAVDSLYPGSGVPKLAAKLEKTLNLCMYICSRDTDHILRRLGQRY
jgi:hypothetical protein